MFKSPTQPLCRYCAKPIRKHTISVYVKLETERSENHRSHSGFSRYVYVAAPIKSKAECQKLTNYAVISVSWNRKEIATMGGYERQPERDHIGRFTEWDGETYDDEFFCSGEHAKNFAYSLARSTTFAMKAWHAAMQAREARQGKPQTGE